MNEEQARSSAPQSLRAAAQAAGFRSVERVRIYADGGRVAAEATGVLHRYPRTVPVSLAAATWLVRAGARLSIDPSANVGRIA